MKKQINPSIKAHLIGGAFYLLLLVAVCAIPFALAQRNASKRSVAKPAAKPNLSAIAKLRQTAPPLTRAISAPAATDISKTGQLQLPHYMVTGAISRRARSECRDSRRGLSIPRAHRVR